jgi:translocation and assembly module TamA
VESESEFDTQLLLPSVSWQTVSADDLRNPSRGYRVSASLRAADSGLGSDISFAQLSLNAKSVYTLGGGRLLGRVQVGHTYINDDDRLPSSLSFFAGGDHSVRGYDFESLGVTNDDGDLVGGQNMLAASVEYEQRIIGAFALAAFIDAGDAYDTSLDLKVGVGIGARWRLPFGAVRFDIASARDLEGEPVRLHFTFGTDL